MSVYSEKMEGYLAQLTGRSVTLENGIPATMYGIKISIDNQEIFHYNDLTADAEKARVLLKAFAESGVSVRHINDVIEDFIV